MNILIVGGAGFIGSNLAHYFVNKGGHTITIIDNLITGSIRNIQDLIDNKQATYIQKDITDTDFSDTLSESFDLIFHLASPASPVQYAKYPIETLMTNSIGTKNLLDLMKKTKSKSLVYASTSEIYGDPLEHPQKETYWGNVNTQGPRSCYDEAKRFGEALCMSYIRKFTLDIRIARIFNTYGPNMEKDDGRVVSNFINQALANHDITVYGEGKQTRSLCYVDDMCEALTRLGTTDLVPGTTINLGNNLELTVKQIAEKIIGMTKSKSQIVNLPLPPDEPQRRKPDLTRAKELLNWEPSITLETGLEKTIDYFKSNYHT